VSGLRWGGTVLYLIGMVLTAMNIYPLNLFFGAFGGFAWMIVGIIWKDRALVLVEAASATIYTVGLGFWLYNLSHH
jgi:hypothetical protein